jgi:uncharacterized cupin superfamily protein
MTLSAHQTTGVWGQGPSRRRLFLLLALIAAPAQAATVHPAVIPAAEAKGPVFDRPGVVVAHGTRDAISVMTGDRMFNSGMYEAGPGHAEWKDKDYGVDEFMLFTKGSVTLTSIDGTVTKLGPGDAVTIPAEWRGTWDTQGYTKYYVIRSRGKPLE